MQLTVADAGMGIAPEAPETVFQPFERGAQARQAGIPGSGLGLSIGQEIAQAHGGALVGGEPRAGPRHDPFSSSRCGRKTGQGGPRR